MGRHTSTKFLVAGLVALTSCSPVSSGPELPRPAQVVGVVPTSLVTTTTTRPDARARATADCPGAFCVIYRVAAEARWSDGAPVRASDFVNTFEVMADPAHVGGPDGYDLISAVEIFDDRTVRVVFTAKFGAWQGLFGRLVPPGQAWADLEGSPTTGPYHVTEIVPGDRVVMERTEGWWGESGDSGPGAPDVVREATIVFIDDPAEMITALADGTVDVITTRAEPDLVAALHELAEVRFDVTPGPFWEHIDFHHEDVLLSEKWVRQVIDLAIDRQKILDRTVRAIDPNASGLDNTIWLETSYGYEKHYADRHDPVAAERILVEHGCAREGDLYTCGENVMSFVWASTNDDPMRRVVFESARDDLAAVGIQLAERFRSPSNFVTRDFLFGGPDVWQLINFSWRGRSDPGESVATYVCDDPDFNVNRYCSEIVEELLLLANMELDPATRAELLNEADELYLDDLAVIPLYQKPNVMAWHRSLDGPVPNYSTSGDLWNLETWTGKESIVIALPSVRFELNSLASDEPTANTVLGPLLYGAFGMDPTLRYTPLLLESVDVVEG